MKRIHSTLAAIMAALVLSAAATQAGAQSARSEAHDQSERLREVLPADVAERVLARIADARARGLPAQALERTALKGAAREVPPADIERAVDAHAKRLERAQQALSQARGRRPSGEEVEAGAEAMRKGVDGASVSELAQKAPSGRSLVVPLHVIGSLVSRGLPSDKALAEVFARLDARDTDAQLAQLPEQVASRAAGKPDLTGRDLAATKRPGSAGRPAGVPANAGAGARPTVPVNPPVSAPLVGGRP